jgi:tetratricopeptide (TPR) repeat protein
MAQSGDEQGAVEHYGKALSHWSDHLEAATELEQYARQQEDWNRVAEMLELKLKNLGESERLEALCELGKIYSEIIGQPERGVSCLEQARDLDPNNVEVLTALADGYYAADELDQAEPILKRLIEVAGNKRRRQMARYVYRVGAIAEKRGELEAAHQSYEKAYKMDSTNGLILVALGRLYIGQEDWQNARRIYRSMLLQDLDKSAGITKADVFYNLGRVHAALKEPDKARSMFERGLEQDPTHQALKAALAELEG